MARVTYKSLFLCVLTYNKAMSFSPEQPVPQPECESKPESRFGDKERLCSILEHPDSIEIEGSIDELFKKTTPRHRNQVDVAKLRSIGINSDNLMALHILADGEDVYAVYKPYTGEHADHKGLIGVEKLYTREVLAYRVSEHFDFDLVPPTVLSEHALEGEKGSIQLFMDHNHYATYEHSTAHMSEDQNDNLEESTDFQAMAALDFLLLNIDRHGGNYLVEADLGDDEEYHPSFTNPEEVRLCAIDNGSSMGPKGYRNMRDLCGPQFVLSGQRSTTQAKGEFEPRDVPLPDWLLNKLEDGLSRAHELKVEDLEDLTPDDIVWMWQRTALLIEEKKFVSKVNVPKVSEAAVAIAAEKGVVSEHPHPPLTNSYLRS